MNLNRWLVQNVPMETWSTSCKITWLINHSTEERKPFKPMLLWHLSAIQSTPFLSCCVRLISSSQSRQPILREHSSDRIHLYIPGWEVNILKESVFSKEFGFIVDYLAEILKQFRKYDYTNLVDQYVDFDPSYTGRDKLAIRKNVLGFGEANISKTNR